MNNTDDAYFPATAVTSCFIMRHLKAKIVINHYKETATYCKNTNYTNYYIPEKDEIVLTLKYIIIYHGITIKFANDKIYPMI
jgi:hypothetical protein